MFWLSIDHDGQGIVYMGAGYQARRISTPAIEFALSQYATLSDAVGMVFLQAGHTFYVLSFPTADATWVFDMGESMWSQWTWTDSDGIAHRHRTQVMQLAYGVVLGGDWQNGALCELQQGLQTDFLGPIVYERAMPHLVLGLNRVTYDRFVLDVQCGEGIPEDPTLAPQVSLSVSDTRGKTYWQAPTQSLGRTGEYYALPQWWQLGMARDRVFLVSWSDPVVTALNGAYAMITLSGT